MSSSARVSSQPPFSPYTFVVSVAHSSALDALWVSLSVFLVVLSFVLVYVVIRLRSTADRLAASLEEIEAKADPALRNVEATVERMNARLDGIDRVADRAVGTLSRLESRLGRVTSAVARPAERIAALTARTTRAGEERTG
jgi:hypothetical protein